MPDYAMCGGEGCPRKADCYRHRAVPIPRRQEYFMPLHPDGSCDHFMQLRKGDSLTDLPPPADAEVPRMCVIKS